MSFVNMRQMMEDSEERTCSRSLVLGVLAALRARSLAPLFWCCSLLAAPLTFIAEPLNLALDEVCLPTRAAEQLVNNHRLPFYKTTDRFVSSGQMKVARA